VDIAPTVMPTYDHVDDLSWIASQDRLHTAIPVTLDISLFTPAEHYPMGWIRSGTPLGKVTATGLWGPYSGGTVDEVQRLTFGGTVSSGTYTITYSGQTTAAIAYNATAAQVQAALVALSNIGEGDVYVTGGPGPTALDIKFAGTLANADVAQVTVTSSLGGSSPTLTPSTVTAGGGDASSDGREVLRKFLYGTVKPHVSPAGTVDTSVRVAGAGLVPYRVRLARLPIPVDATGQADLAGQTEFI
jgi:hypothetical protein